MARDRKFQSPNALKQFPKCASIPTDKGGIVYVISLMKASEKTYVIDLFKKRLSMEVPKGRMTNSEVRRMLENCTTFVCRKNGSIQGFVSFTAFKKEVNLKFIYAHTRRHGIGTLLMGRVAKYAIKNGLTAINSEVSVLDRAASGFYSSVGFKTVKRINYFLYKIGAKPSAVIANSYKPQ